MNISEIREHIPDKAYEMLSEKIEELRPSQEKAIQNGLFQRDNLLICTPTASGKTFIAEMAYLKNIKENRGKTVYIVPLKALASEKFKEFSKRYGEIGKVGMSIGNTDSPENYLDKYDIIFTTSEKFDSLLRHHSPWISKVSTLIIDEIHLLNDASRGPTLEILITLLKELVPDIHMIGLSATIGNPEELAGWMGAKSIVDKWRPVELHQGIYREKKITYY